jgi:hypothetical protein
MRDEVHSWWIVREMPLDHQRRRRKKFPPTGTDGGREQGSSWEVVDLEVIAAAFQSIPDRWRVENGR